MPLRSRRKHQYVDVPVHDMVLRITGPEEMYEEARATGMGFVEQLQSYAIRDPQFRSSKSPVTVPEDAPGIIREMAELSARAGVGPMFTVQGAVTEFVGRRMARTLSDLVVSCGGDYYVVARRRSRLMVYPRPGDREGMAVVVKPELGPQGIYTTMERTHLPADSTDGVVVVASSCILADAAAAAATAILGRPNSLKAALSYLQQLNGVHGAIVLRGERIGVAGNLEFAA